MSRINTNVQSMIANRILNHNKGALNTALERLSTGLRINRGKDDPAGLIASENLRSEIKATSAAINNAERNGDVVLRASVIVAKHTIEGSDGGSHVESGPSCIG